MENGTIRHISDTALWIAGFRAQESERADAVFHDPLAKKLAGERGKEMVASTPGSKAMAFAMVARTTAIDRLITTAIGEGVDTVINLGAGLDTRPYRMELPPQLRWIEVDFEHMVAYKNEQLRSERPRCYLERIAADLSQEEERKKLFAQLGSATRKALVITEGVVAYLTNEQATRLSVDILAVPAFHYWIQDFSQGKARRNRLAKKLGKMLRSTPLRFDVASPLSFFGQHGWKVKETIFILDEADRLGRRLPFIFPWSLLIRLFPAKAREIGNRTYGYVMLERP